jgi:preprotein translocase subunit SecG
LPLISLPSPTRRHPEAFFEFAPMLLFLNVIYVLIAIAMVALILMQRGAGAQAGSGFGGGASGTVFGARGASNFLSKSTKWLAVLFFSISLFMAWQASNSTKKGQSAQDLGLMSQVPVAPAKAPTGNQTVPLAPAATAPASSVPQAPAATTPAAPSQPASQQPAQQQPPSGG